MSDTGRYDALREAGQEAGGTPGASPPNVSSPTFAEQGGRYDALRETETKVRRELEPSSEPTTVTPTAPSVEPEPERPTRHYRQQDLQPPVVDRASESNIQTSASAPEPMVESATLQAGKYGALRETQVEVDAGRGPGPAPPELPPTAPTKEAEPHASQRVDVERTPVPAAPDQKQAETPKDVEPPTARQLIREHAGYAGNPGNLEFDIYWQAVKDFTREEKAKGYRPAEIDSAIYHETNGSALPKFKENAPPTREAVQERNDFAVSAALVRALERANAIEARRQAGQERGQDRELSEPGR